MFRIALRNMLAHKARLLMTTLAVVLGVAFVAGTLMFTATISKGLRDAASRSFADVSVAVRPAAGDSDAARSGHERAGVPQEVYERLAGLPGVASARGTVSGYTGVADADDELIGDGFLNEGGNYAPGSDGSDPRVDFTEGRGPESPGEVALDADTAEAGGYEVGDEVRLSVSGPVLTRELTGIFTTDDGRVAAGGTLALFDTPTAQRLFLEEGLYDQVELTAEPGTTQQQLRDAVPEDLLDEHGLEAVTGQQLIDDQAAAIADQTSEINTVLLGFAAIALFVGVLLIANTFSMLVAQRTREVALLRAVGASRRQITRCVLAEAGLLGAVSAVAGIVLGIGVAAGLRPLLNNAGAGLPDNPLVINPGSVIASLAVGVGITLLSAYLPSRRAARTSPLAALRSVDVPPPQRRLAVRNVIGSLLTAVGLLVVLAMVVTGQDQGATLIALGAVCAVCGLIMLTAALSRPLFAALAPLVRRFGAAGKLARQNAARNPRRTAATATALMIGLALTSALTVITVSLQNSIQQGAADGLRADYAVRMSNFGPVDPEVVETVREVPGVRTAAGESRVSLELDGDSTTAVMSDGAAFADVFRMEIVQGDVSALARGEIAVSEGYAEDRGLRPGDTLQVSYPDGAEETVTLGAVYADSTVLSDLVVGQELLAPHLFRLGYQTVYVDTERNSGEGGDDSAVIDRIEAALGNSPVIQVSTPDDLFRDANRQLNQLLYMVYGLLGMSLVIAVFGVVNTMALSVFERSRELGMLRAIGLDRAGVKRMITLESLMISMLGAVLGLALGTFLAWAAGEVAQTVFTRYSTQLPWDSYGVFFVLTLVMGALAALWPARQAARLHPLEALRTE